MDEYGGIHQDGELPAVEPNPGDVLAHRLLLLKALGDRVTGLIADTKAELRQGQHIRPGGTLRPPLADGKPAGAVSYSVSSESVHVTDEQALGGWLAKHYPSAVELRLVPREWMVEQLKTAAEAAGVVIGPGGEAGEFAPPGIRIGQREGHISARPDPKRAEALWAEMRTLTTELEAGTE